MYYHIFLDDTRMPAKVNWIELPLVDWVVIRNYKDFVDIITKYGVPQTISFDHDLAEEHYATGINGAWKEGDMKVYDTFKEKQD